MTRRILLALAVALVLAHCWWFSDFTVDDGAISFTFARNLAHGDGLVLFPGGEHVEGYTNFLWVVLLALGVRLGLDVFLWSHLLGGALAALTIVGVAELVAAVRGRRSPWDTAPALVAATLLPIPYWAMSGLEGPLYCAAVVWMLERLVVEQTEPERRPWSALCAAAAALTRPDGLLLWGLACALRLLRPRPWRKLASWSLWAVAPLALHLAFRIHYYAYPLPNTFYAKMGQPFQPRELWDLKSPGWRYVLDLWKRYDLIALLVPALGALVPGPRWWMRLGIAAGLAGLVFFPIYARGDWMSEGRFLVGALPLLCVLAAIGIERVAAFLPGRARLPSALVLALVVAALVVPRSLQHSKERRHGYPVPAQFVAKRGNFYRETATKYGAVRPTALDGDLGGTSFYAGMPIVDLGMLGDVTMSHWRWHPGILREYVHGERRPTFLRLIGFWLQDGLQDHPEFAERYIPSRKHEDISIDRRIFQEEAIDTRQPLGKLGGADLIRAELGAEVRLWLLVHEARPQLTLIGQGARVPVNHPYLDEAMWRPGEVVIVSLSRPAGALQLCAHEECVPLADGASGALPAALPKVDGAALDRAHARGELELELAWSRQAGDAARLGALGRAFERRSRTALETGDTARAFRDAQAALEADPGLAWERRLVEELRLQPRESYHYRFDARLERAVRELRLQPDADRLGLVAQLAQAAGHPERAALAHLATRLVPNDPADRLALAECLLAAGAVEEAARLLPISAADDEGRVRAHRLAVAAGHPEWAPLPADKARPIAPGLGLFAAWAHLTPSGRVELSLALTRLGDAPDRITVAGQPSAFDRPPSTWAPNEVVVHRVALRLAAGRSTVQAGSLALTVEVAPFTHDFEAGTLDGWSASGRFGATPAHYRRGQPWKGFQGDVFADGAGQLVSPPLSAGVDEACVLLGGRAHLHVEGKPDLSARGDAWLRDLCIDLHDLPDRAGAVLTIAGDGAARFQLDDAGCFARGRPVPCAGSARILE